MEAVLVAGGEGKRLGSAAGGLPKALVEVAGRPLSSYMVERLGRAAVKRVVVSCALGAGRLFEQRLSGYGCAVEAVEEPERLGRGGGLRLAAQRLSSSAPFFVVYGDELLDVDLSELRLRHAASGAALTLTSFPLSIAFGLLEMDEAGRVSHFREAPTLSDHWVNVGLYLMEHELVAELPERGDVERELFPLLASSGRLFAYRHSGIWLTVNTLKDLEAAEQLFREQPDWLEERPRRFKELRGDLRRLLARAQPSPLADASRRAALEQKRLDDAAL